MSDTSTTKTNLTIKLDKALIRKLRVLAAQRDTSISGLIAAKLEEEVDQNERYEEARRHALELMDKGWNLGGKPLRREELYDR